MNSKHFLEEIFNKILPKRKRAARKMRVGLDVGQAAVRALTLSLDKEKSTITCFTYVPIVGKNVSDAIKKATSSLNLANSLVNVGLSGTGVIIRYIELPKMTKEELRNAIKFEAEKHIPLPVKDVNLDAYILDEDLPGGQIFVLLAAVKKELIEESLLLMSSCGLEVNIIDINTIALINTYLHSQGLGLSKEDKADTSVALLDIGYSFSTLDIIEGKIPRLTRDISIGSKSFTAINKETLLLNLANEIRRSFDFYESQSEKSLTAIFLSGEGAKSEGIEEFLTQNLSLPIKFWDPSLNCEIADSVDKDLIKSCSHTLAVPLGLALRN